jgi:hypothetical protein
MHTTTSLVRTNHLTPWAIFVLIHIVTFFVASTLASGCEQSNGQGETRLLTEQLDKELTRSWSTDFKVGDVSGTTSILSNRDSTSHKVTIKYAVGDYGNEETIYYIHNLNLIYAHKTTNEWTGHAGYPYIISETKYYFPDDGNGIRERRELKTNSSSIANSFGKLQKLPFKAEAATMDDYQLMLDEVEQQLR